MQTTTEPAIPKELKQLQSSWWSLRKRLSAAQADNLALREQNALFEKIFNLVDGYFILKGDERLKEDFLNLEARLMTAIAIAKNQTIRNIAGFDKGRHSREEVKDVSTL